MWCSSSSIYCEAIYSGRWIYVENRDGALGTRAIELQSSGGGEDGWRTNQSKAYPEIAARLSTRLRAWDEAHPRADAEKAVLVPPQQTEQLRALGYVE